MYKPIIVAVFPLFLFSSFIGGKPKANAAASVELHLRAMFGDKPLVMFQTYDYGRGQRIFFDVFDFYLSDVTLLSEESGKEVKVMELHLIDFSNIADSSSAKKGITLRLDNVPPGNYTALQIGIGVPVGLNKPGDYPNSHPLGGTGGEMHYWDAWKSYVFSRIQGKADVDRNGVFSDLADKSLVYHLGGNPLYRKIVLPLRLHLKKNKTGKIQLDVDLKQLFVRGGGMLDLAEFPMTHSQSNQVPPIAEDMVNKWEKAFQLE